MPICETTDFIYPMLADIYYPIVEQGAYGNIKKQWVLDRTVAVSLTPAGRKAKEDLKPNVNIVLDNNLYGRSRSDILSSSSDSLNAQTNVVIANIRDRHGKIIYNESAGVRAGKSTLFEISTFIPVVGPFGTVDHYKLVVARSENQAADI